MCVALSFFRAVTDSKVCYSHMYIGKVEQQAWLPIPTFINNDAVIFSISLPSLDITHP